MVSKGLAIIAGVGPGTVCPLSSTLVHDHCRAKQHPQGASIARRFAQSYSVAVLSRTTGSYEPLVQEINSAGGNAIGISTDVSDANSVNAAFDQIEKQFPDSPLAASIFNPAGGFVRKPFLELTNDEFSQALDSQAYASLLLRPTK